jgi:hypothetical protein
MTSLNFSKTHYLIIGLGLLILAISSCGSHVQNSVTELQNSNAKKEIPSKQDSANYKKGIEHSVNEKLIKKYKKSK